MCWFPDADEREHISESPACLVHRGFSVSTDPYTRSTVMSKPNLGFIGLGIMGRPMVKNLLKADYSVTVWNRSEPGILECVDAGAQRGDSPSDVAAKSDIVISCVTDSPDVEMVYLGENGVIESARDGMIAIDMSTISPSVARDVATALGEKGAIMLDAPVSGGDKGAIEGTLSIMVGGPEETFNEMLPVFEAMGKRITYIGPSGDGQVTKLCNQIAGAVNILAMSEALVLAAKSGANVAKVLEAISAGAAGSWMLTNLGPKILERDFDPGFMVRLQQKDLRLVLDAAKELKMSVPGTALVNQLFQAVEAHGLGDDGTQSLVKALEGLALVEVNG
jgi:3-hydroxyisobutyrate dehydrogenase